MYFAHPDFFFQLAKQSRLCVLAAIHSALWELPGTLDANALRHKNAPIIALQNRGDVGTINGGHSCGGWLTGRLIRHHCA